ncbi:hypothetical protein ACWD7F_32875 [Streptomyces sp. NPDC005122]
MTTNASCSLSMPGGCPATRRAPDRLGAEVDLERVQLRDYGRHLVNKVITGYPSEELRPVLDTVALADGSSW